MLNLNRLKYKPAFLGLAIILNLFLPAALFAETIVLKSGKEMQGKIIEQTGQYVKIELNDGAQLYYERKYIKDIQEDAASSPSDVNFYLKSGLKYGSEGKFKEAREEFKKGLAINSSGHNLEEALKIINDLESGKIKEEYAFHLFKGSHYLINAQYELALTEFKEALALNPADPELSYYLGVCDYSLGQYQEAIAYLEKAAETKADDEVYYYLGLSHYAQGQRPEAIAYMQKVLEINPQDAEAYSIIGSSKYLLGDIQEAKDAFFKAKELFREKGDYLKGLEIEELMGKLN